MTTIAVSIFPPRSGMSVWSNGAHQNIFFLAALLRLVPGVSSVVLVNAGDGDPPKPEELPPEVRDLAVVRAADLGDVDVLIEAGAQLEAALVARIHERGGKAIAYKFGASLPIDAERLVNDSTTHGGGIFNGAVFDEVWTTAQHVETSGSYWETCYRCPVRVLPHVWEPWFVDAMIATFPPGLVAGYQPGRAKKRLVIAAPNINMIKTCHVPMLIAEQAWRRRPDLVDRVLVTNAIQFRNRVHFEHFVGALDVAKAKADDGSPVMTFESRYRIPWLMAAHGDVLLDHAWIDTPNYLHYDALSMGFPLVHNITGMPGYRYGGFDARGGAAALIRAMTEHDSDVRGYNEAAHAFLNARRATNPVSVAAHARALAEVMAT